MIFSGNHPSSFVRLRTWLEQQWIWCEVNFSTSRSTNLEDFPHPLFWRDSSAMATIGMKFTQPLWCTGCRLDAIWKPLFFSCLFNPQKLLRVTKSRQRDSKRSPKKCHQAPGSECPTAWPLCWNNQRSGPRHLTCFFHAENPQKKRGGDPKGTSFLGPKNDHVFFFVLDKILPK